MANAAPHAAVRAVLTIAVKPENAEEFERAWAPIADWARTVPGCLRQSLCRMSTDEPTYVITSDWIDAEAFARFEKSDDQDRLTAPLRRLRESIRMELYTLVEHRD